MIEFCKICGRPFEGGVPKLICTQCNRAIDPSCIGNKENKETEGIICTKCIQAKKDLHNRVNEKWMQYRETKE